MKKRAILASTLTASALTTGYTIIDQFTKKILYRERLDKENQIDWYSDLNGFKFKIKNHKNLSLQAYLFEEENASSTVIALHGLKQSSIALKPMISVLKQLFPQSNILLYDANAHGLSDGYIRGFGYKDITDLMYFNAYVLQKYGKDHTVYMYGKGMGANTILNAAGLNKLNNVKLIISEAAYAHVYDYLSYLCQRDTNISAFINQGIIRGIIKSEVGLDVKKINTAQLVKHNTVPTVFIHSKEDQDVDFSNVLKLYNHNSSVKHLFPLKDELSLIDLSDDYSQVLVEFVNENK